MTAHTDEPRATPPTPPGFLDRLTERQLLLFVLLVGALLYLPFAGSYGLFDPWETHYGEVGRQMARRNDFISLYWPGSPLDGEYFWSKPVLTFWIMALSMKLFGIGGAGLPPGEFALSSVPEWAMRVPFCLLALLALAGVYLPVSRFVSRRAGLLAALALATFPMFGLVARQAMTDMAFIGPMTLGLGLCALALFDDEDAVLPRRQWGGFSWPHHRLFYTTVALLTVTVVPQLVVSLVQLQPVAVAPAIVVAVLAAAGMLTVWITQIACAFRDRHVAWVLGIVPLPVLASGSFTLFTSKLRLLEMGLKWPAFWALQALGLSLLAGLLYLLLHFANKKPLLKATAILGYALPFLVLFLRHAFPRLEALRISVPSPVQMMPYLLGFFTFLYFTAQTRYKAPFYLHIASILCGLAMLAKGLAGLGLPVIVFLAYLLFSWNWKRLARAELLRGLPLSILACALVAVPWHHAMLVRHGIPFWNELYGDNHWRRLVTGRHGDRGSFEYFVRELGYGLYPWIALVPAAVSWVVMRAFPARRADGATTDKRRDILWFGAIWFVAGYALVSLSMTKFHHYILPALPGLAIALGCFLDDVLTEKRGRVALLAVVVGLPLLALVAHDLTSAEKSAQRFIWLFSYDYVNAPQGRPWPTDMNFVRPLWIFAGLFAASTFLLAWQRIRAWAAVATFAVAVAFTYFLLDVYMPRAATHWSQKPLIAQYYRERRSPEERLLVWQMYWRGENFYTQNQIYEGPISERTVFLGDKNAENLKEFIGRHSGRRHYFLIERSRLESLRSLLPAAAQQTLKIANDNNNKFYLLTANL